MTSRGTLLLILSIVFVAVTAIDFYDDLRGDYCRARRPRTCCPGRDDYCTMPILDTVCYCDIFCNRTNGDDCCPDFWEHCLGVRRPTPQSLINPYCYEGNAGYTVGQKVKKNCNTCECRKTASNKFEFVCENKPCLVQPKLNDVINRGNYGWRASNYSFFWGRTLEYGIRYRLGTFKPYRETMHMNEIRTLDRQPLPESFDSRRRWPRMIQDIRDQGECGSSWAFSTSALASDRRAIQSRGRERLTLSPQHLISCNTRGQQGCEGGHIDRAWWFLRNQGLTSEQCYPYTSGHSGKKGLCRIPRGRHKRLRCPSGIRGVKNRSTPPYRVGPSESDIMHEVYKNGPVQATFRVMQDFFSYASGIYRKLPLTNTNPSSQGWHSVRIIGWGVEKRGGRNEKYWICANSWGSGWGEDGYFRIIRGQNECDIETFVVGVWAKRNSLRRTNAG